MGKTNKLPSYRGTLAPLNLGNTPIAADQSDAFFAIHGLPGTTNFTHTAVFERRAKPSELALFLKVNRRDGAFG